MCFLLQLAASFRFRNTFTYSHTRTALAGARVQTGSRVSGWPFAKKSLVGVVVELGPKTCRPKRKHREIAKVSSLFPAAG